MDPPPPAASPPSRPPDASEEPGAPATATATASAAPVTDTTDSTQADAQGGLHDTAISNPENNNDTSTSTRGDSHSPWISEEHLGESLVQTTSKQAANSDGTRKRNFQPGNKEAVHAPSAGSKSHARDISVVETKDARSKFLKKSDNEDPACEDRKNADLAGISEELKENNNRSSLNSSSLKDEKKQKNRSRGKENSNHVHNTSTLHDISLPTTAGTSCLTSMVTENNAEAPKCMGLRLKKNPDDVSLTNSFTVVNAETTDGGNLNVDSTIQKNFDEVLPGSLKEKETENVATSLGSSVLHSSQLASSNVSLMPLQGVIVDADVKTNCLHSSTEEKVYRSAVSEDVTKPSDHVSQPNIAEEHKNFGSGKHMREAILHTSVNSAGIEKVLPSENQKNQSYPFNEGANFFQRGNADRNFRADVHHRRNIYGSGGMGNSEYEFQRNQSHPFSEGRNFFPLGREDPNLRAGVHHSMDMYGSGGMGNSEYGLQRNRSYSFNEGADFFQLRRADPNFRVGVHHSMNIYGSGAMENSEHGFQRNRSYPFDEGANFFQLGRPDPNFRAGVHHSMNIYGSGAMGSSEHGFQRNQSYLFNEGANFFQPGRPDPNFREGVHHSMNMYGSDARRNSEHGFGRSYLDHTSTVKNEMQEKERTCLSTNHNNDQISPSNLAQAYSEKLRMSFPPRDSLTGFRKKKLLILDLNGLLADINEDFHNAHMADAKVRRKLVFRRPHCDDFLNFCIKNFELGVWSSRKRKNVDSAVDILMRDFKPYLLFSWARDKCTMTGRNTLENVHKPIVLKELKKLWNKEEPGLPWKEGEFSPSNTLLVDDSPYKALRNPVFSQLFSYTSVLFNCFISIFE
uniref:FCP1 homology domain-containing protein n=1 Tax=Triticum aestivum TaxID=4565 RepID=A0A3B6KPI5_WHEAT